MNNGEAVATCGFNVTEETVVEEREEDEEEQDSAMESADEDSCPVPEGIRKRHKRTHSHPVEWLGDMNLAPLCLPGDVQTPLVCVGVEQRRAKQKRSEPRSKPVEDVEELRPRNTHRRNHSHPVVVDPQLPDLLRRHVLLGKRRSKRIARWLQELRARSAPITVDPELLPVPPGKRVRWWDAYHARDQVQSAHEEYEDASLLISCLTIISYFILTVFGYFREFLRASRLEMNKFAQEREQQLKFTPLYSEFMAMYTRNFFIRIADIACRPVCSVPGGTMRIKERISNDNNWTFELTGRDRELMNLGSYNYLGFAECSGSCAYAAQQSIREFGVATCSTRAELGNNRLHRELEELIAEFVGVEDVISFPMGYVTNVGTLPALVGNDCLVISDELNHSSLIVGCITSGAHKALFRHNDIDDLERQIRQAIILGQPKSRRPYKKILVVVEGIYSMEGSIVKLREVIALKKKYGVYVYLDEAHSIGAIGANGGGVCEYWGVDPADIDVMMGTFTKTFGSVGGYIGGSKELIDYLRIRSHVNCYGTSIPPPAAQQVISSMRITMGKDGGDEGQKRIRQLAMNSRYFRRRLKQMGFIIYGNDDSPVIPLLVYFFPKVASFCREADKRGLAVVAVGYPATPLTLARGRFCMSAAHSREQLDHALAIISEIGDEQGLKYSRKPLDPDTVIQFC